MSRAEKAIIYAQTSQFHVIKHINNNGLSRFLNLPEAISLCHISYTSGNYSFGLDYLENMKFIF